MRARANQNAQVEFMQTKMHECEVCANQRYTRAV